MTADFKRIVCLANSYKPGGRCVAGREISRGNQLGRWVRPVCEGEEGGVGDERLYEDGSDPQVLDVIEVPVLGAKPEYHQTENWLIHPEYYWEKVNQLAPSDIEGFIHPTEPLWLDGYNTSNGQNDRIPFEYAKNLKDSLRLIRVSSLEISEENSRDSNALVLRGHFEHAGQEYALRITDPAFSEKYFRQPPAGNLGNNILMTVSLGGLFYGYSYKLIAAIIEP